LAQKPTTRIGPAFIWTFSTEKRRSAIRPLQTLPWWIVSARLWLIVSI
jgi:hypothetical protein